MGEARKSTTKFVTVPFLTLRFHSPVRITLNALVILKPDSGTVIAKELICPMAEKVFSGLEVVPAAVVFL
jgi:hypothetical protein